MKQFPLPNSSIVVANAYYFIPISVEFSNQIPLPSH